MLRVNKLQLKTSKSKKFGSLLHARARFHFSFIDNKLVHSIPLKTCSNIFEIICSSTGPFCFRYFYIK